ncbi:MAG TPA: metallophosphoesterase family protein [Candidatus Baltobacterales bacterium]|nr:metallophosphoesterase family protein [Candidatus Baltobacterales bacterium]
MRSRIGVVADTHCPEFADRLPPRLGEVLAGVDLILHAGDINEASTLTELERIAPVAAVRGDHDTSLASLPRSREVEVGGKKIVVVHGDRSRWLEEPETLLWTLSLGYFHPHGGLARSLRRRFPSADVIVFGHTHRAHAEVIDGTLLFNPGGVHQWNPATAVRRLGQRPGWFEWCWLRAARHLRSFPQPSVGILEVGEGGVTPQVVPL